ncbi:hypothetical protein ACEPAI_9271 [Sanghuangporus weigelae]
MESISDEDMLTRTLNSLLASLELPLVLQCPLELTPSDILVILESMLRMKLPISSETRKCKTHAARVEAMKIFIGVLEDDVLGVDVGLGDIDPRRLAEGRRKELLRVVETLCWLGKRMNYISQDGLSVGNVARSSDCTLNDGGGGVVEEPGSPSMLSAMSTVQDSSLVTYSARSLDDSQTTITTHITSENAQDTLEEDAFSLIGQLSPSHRGRRHRTYPEQVLSHEVDEDQDAEADILTLRKASRRYDSGSDDSNADDPYCRCESDISEFSSAAPPIRTAGYLELVDLDEELRAYELRRKRSTKRTPRIHHRHPASFLSSNSPQSSSGIITRHTSPLQYNLALLDERARLLSELARLRHDRS